MDERPNLGLPVTFPDLAQPRTLPRNPRVTTGAKKGQRPSPATVTRMLREHDEQAATSVDA